MICGKIVMTEYLQGVSMTLHLTSSQATDAKSPHCMCAPQTDACMQVYKQGGMGGTQNASKTPHGGTAL